MNKQRGLIITKITLGLAALGVMCVALTPAPQTQPKQVAVGEAPVTKAKMRRSIGDFTCDVPMKKADKRKTALALVLALRDPRALAITCRG